MKNILNRLLIVLVPICLLLSCAKSTSFPGSSSLMIVNAVVGNDLLIVRFSGTDSVGAYNAAMVTKYGDSVYNEFSGYVGKQKIALYRYQDTIFHGAPLFNLVLDLPIGSIHTLFLTGTVSQPDTLFTSDFPPYHPPTDSSVGVRFVNLSPGSGPVSVNLAGSLNGSEVAGLPFKGITEFKNYPAIAELTSYTFELRDSISGDLLGTYTMQDVGNNNGINKWRYRNYTIALEGLPGVITGSFAQRVLGFANF